MRLRCFLTSENTTRVSIHAPREGCDTIIGSLDRCTDVSIHAPREGCDIRYAHLLGRELVSIHAPREGCDQQGSLSLIIEEGGFNSRTPGGVRLLSEYRCGTCAGVSIHAPREGCDRRPAVRPRSRACFNSRTPGGVRLSRCSRGVAVSVFQFTHPGRGATKLFKPSPSDEEFQFTHPGRGATVALDQPVGYPSVSIHAPREGCDSVVQSCVL